MNTVNVRNIVIGEGIPKICVPIVGKTKEELLSEVEVLKTRSNNLNKRKPSFPY